MARAAERHRRGRKKIPPGARSSAERCRAAPNNQPIAPWPSRSTWGASRMRWPSASSRPIRRSVWPCRCGPEARQTSFHSRSIHGVPRGAEGVTVDVGEPLVEIEHWGGARVLRPPHRDELERLRVAEGGQRDVVLQAEEGEHHAHLAVGAGVADHLEQVALACLAVPAAIGVAVPAGGVSAVDVGDPQAAEAAEDAAAPGRVAVPLEVGGRFGFGFGLGPAVKLGCHHRGHVGRSAGGSSARMLSSSAARASAWRCAARCRRFIIVPPRGPRAPRCWPA